MAEAVSVQISADTVLRRRAQEFGSAVAELRRAAYRSTEGRGAEWQGPRRYAAQDRTEPCGHGVEPGTAAVAIDDRFAVLVAVQRICRVDAFRQGRRSRPRRSLCKRCRNRAELLSDGAQCRPDGRGGVRGDPASAALGGRPAGVAASGGGAPVNVVFNVSAQDAGSFRKSEAQITGMLARAASRGARTF